MSAKPSVEMYLCAFRLGKWEADESVEEAYHRALDITAAHPPCHGAHPKRSFTGGESLARREHRQVQERFSHGGNTRWRYGYPDVTDARHDGDVQIGPHRLEQRCKLIRIE
jgi:hypothetical protein